MGKECFLHKKSSRMMRNPRGWCFVLPRKRKWRSGGVAYLLGCNIFLYSAGLLSNLSASFICLSRWSVF